MKQTPLSKAMHANVDWIMQCSANKEGPKKITDKFNKHKLPKGVNKCKQETMGQFIQHEKIRRDRAVKPFNKVLTSAWNKEALKELAA